MRGSWAPGDGDGRTVGSTDVGRHRERRRGLTKTHKRMLGAAGSIAVVVLVFAFVLPRIADYRDVFDVVRDLGWQDWAALAGAVVLNLATFPPPWMAALRGSATARAWR